MCQPEYADVSILSDEDKISFKREVESLRSSIY